MPQSLLDMVLERMNREKFLVELQEIMMLEEPLTDSMILAELEDFDSMAKLSYMALVEENFGLELSSDDVDNAETVGDLMLLAAL